MAYWRLLREEIEEDDEEEEDEEEEEEEEEVEEESSGEWELLEESGLVASALLAVFRFLKTFRTVVHMTMKIISPKKLKKTARTIVEVLEELLSSSSATGREKWCVM